MEDRTGFWKRMSDGFLSPPITKILYRSYIKTDRIDINGWSLVHFLTGSVSSMMNIPLSTYVIVHCIFEIFQLWAEENELDLTEFIDISLDILFGVLGYIITNRVIL